jgi:hypothetical protein
METNPATAKIINRVVRTGVAGRSSRDRSISPVMPKVMTSKYSRARSPVAAM